MPPVGDEIPRPDVPPGKILVLLAGLSVAAGVAFRIAGVFQDMWFDEVASLDFALKLSTPLDLLTQRHDLNDTPLQAAWIWLLGRRERWEWYRVYPLAAGLFSVVLTGLLARRAGRRVAGVALVLSSLSYMMVHYASELRGYAAAGFFALVSFSGLMEYLETRRPSWRTLFWAGSVLGFLSHPTFLFFSVPAAAYSLARPRNPGAGVIRDLPFQARIHGPVVLFLAAYAMWHLSNRVGQGPPYRQSVILHQFAAFTFGFPADPSYWPLIAFPAAILLAGLRFLDREGRRDALAFAAAAVLFPVLFNRLVRPHVFFPRYYYCLVPFLLVGAAYAVVRWWENGRAGKVAAGAFLALFVAGNLYHDVRFLQDGRGGYGDAVRFIIGESQGRSVTVGSDHDYRNGALVRFYAARLPGGEKVVYRIHTGLLEGVHPDWLVYHHVESGIPPPPGFLLESQVAYGLRREFTFYGLAGFDWFIYRRLTDEGTILSPPAGGG